MSCAVGGGGGGVSSASRASNGPEEGPAALSSASEGGGDRMSAFYGGSPAGSRYHGDALISTPARLCELVANGLPVGGGRAAGADIKGERRVAEAYLTEGGAGPTES